MSNDIDEEYAKLPPEKRNFCNKCRVALSEKEINDSRLKNMPPLCEKCLPDLLNKLKKCLPLMEKLGLR